LLVLNQSVAKHVGLGESEAYLPQGMERTYRTYLYLPPMMRWVRLKAQHPWGLSLGVPTVPTWILNMCVLGAVLY